MKHASFLIGIALAAILLLGCSQEKDTGYPDPRAILHNPLVAEQHADMTLDYLSSLQIRADERSEPITDPAILRAIDDAFVWARKLQDEAHAAQDQGKKGVAYGVNENFAIGEVLHTDGALYFDPNFEVSAAPKMKLYLAQHVSPHAVEELFSEPTIEIGDLRSIYGAQMYPMQKLTNDEWNKYRTVAFYSEPLNQVIALVQIRGLVKQ